MLVFITNDLIQGEAFYNAYEKDIAVVNIFFGDPTAFGGAVSDYFCFHFIFFRV